MHVELLALTLDNLPVKDYLLQIRMIIDALASIWDPIPVSHHIGVILEDLPVDYASVVYVVESKFGIMDLYEVEILLVAHELHLTKFKKTNVPEVVSLNLTHTNNVNPTPDEGRTSSSESPQACYF